MHPTTIIKPENPLHLPTQKLPLGCPILTRLLNGGIPIGSITELAGESGSGKTQLSLHLLLSSSSSSLFIHTEFPFPLRRLHSLSIHSHPHPNPNPLDRIFVAGAHTPGDLLALLSHAQSSLLPNPPSSLPIKLIVIDSIAALFRSEFDNNAADLRRRSSLFFKISSKLKEIARKFELAVLVTNHVVDVVGSEEGGNGVRIGNYKELWSSGRRVWPALGLSWANCVNVRLFLSRNDEVVRGDSEGLEIGGIARTRRMIQVVFAPHLPESSSEFVILKEGVFGVSL